jgi:hypothetical protein
MSSSSEHPPLRSWLHRLGLVGLGVLLFVQIFLLWVSARDGGWRIPEGVVSLLSQKLQKEGIVLQARNFWILPDLSLAADDLTLEIEPITGEILTVERAEVNLNFWHLGRGKILPNRFYLRGGKVWCPAVASQTGQRRLIIEDIRGEIRKEGAWLTSSGLFLRAGDLIVSAEGKVPIGVLTPSPRPQASLDSLATQITQVLSGLEQSTLIADRAGGASLHLQASSENQGSSQLTCRLVLGNQQQPSLPTLLQARELNFQVNVQLDPAGQLHTWQLKGEAANLVYQKYSARCLEFKLQGTNAWPETQGEIIVADFSYNQIKEVQATIEIHPKGPKTYTQIDIDLFSHRSFASGQILWQPADEDDVVDQFLFEITRAQIDVEDLLRFPEIKNSLQEAGIELNGVIGLANVNIQQREKLGCVDGDITFSGLKAMGLSTQAIAPQRDMPLTAHFDYDPHRTPYALLLRDLQLASVRGEADLSLEKNGAYSLRLFGELHPSCLDQVLGDWWVSLWHYFALTSNPYATIDVSGHWGVEDVITQGRVRLDQFQLFQTPFHSVEISVDANPDTTYIGIHKLAGVNPEADGWMDGSAIWDWRKPVGENGPIIQLSGNLQPWIVAHCADKKTGEFLRGLKLPRQAKLNIRGVQKGEDLAIDATLFCPSRFQAWGVESENLELNLTQKNKILTVESTMGLANGTARFKLRDEENQDAAFAINLSNCDSQMLIPLFESFATSSENPKTLIIKKAPKELTFLNFNFEGKINLAKPEYIRGLGNFSLRNPELEKVRVLGGLSAVLEVVGINATTYNLVQATGDFGCLEGKAYFPNILISGPQSFLEMAGEVDLVNSNLDFEGVFSIPKKSQFNPLEVLNVNRILADQTRVNIYGPISAPKTRSIPLISFLFKSRLGNKLGKIPSELSE